MRRELSIRAVGPRTVGVMQSASASLVRALGRLVGSGHVVSDPDATARFTADWTGRFRGTTPAVVRPGSVAEVAAVVAWCGAEGVAVVPQGGNSGLVGGGVPLAGEVVLHLGRLDHRGEVDPTASQVTAGAGVTLAALHAHARRAGLRYAVDFGARDQATVGGMVATDAGGVHVLRFGATRAQVRGIEAVLGDGSVVRHLAGLEKDRTGYDLAGLLCGSEGTLGVVTAARLRLESRPGSTVVALVGVDGAAEAVELGRAVQRRLSGLEAAEVFFADGLALVCAAFGLAAPVAVGAPAYLLLEVTDRAPHEAGDGEPTDVADLAGALAAALRSAIGRDLDDASVAVAVDAPRRAALWRYREAHTEAINRLGAPHKLDVSLPLGALEVFVAEVRERVATLAPDARCWIFGHALDGNLHVNVTGVAPNDERVDDAVLTLVAARGGSISAEHGIGRAKRRWLHLSRSAAEISAFRALKAALDPAGILNPHVLLPPGEPPGS